MVRSVSVALMVLLVLESGVAYAGSWRVEVEDLVIGERATVFLKGKILIAGTKRGSGGAPERVRKRMDRIKGRVIQRGEAYLRMERRGTRWSVPIAEVWEIRSHDMAHVEPGYDDEGKIIRTSLIRERMLRSREEAKRRWATRLAAIFGTVGVAVGILWASREQSDRLGEDPYGRGESASHTGRMLGFYILGGALGTGLGGLIGRKIGAGKGMIWEEAVDEIAWERREAKKKAQMER